jgi:DNA uptake protein ComE-like DNA-binding protein
MTEDIANSILDWMDPDDEARPNGAETDYYSALTPPYHAKNGPLNSLEELLLVKGVTPQLLLGNDQNRNGVLDPEEDDGSGTLDRGWSAYLTVYSREQNVDSQGNPRINVNDSDLNTLSTNLTNAVGQDLSNFILAYRLYGPAAATTPGRSGTGSPGTGTPGTGTPGRSGSGGGSGGAGGGTSGAPMASGGTSFSIAQGSGGAMMVTGAATVGSSGGGASGTRLSRNQLNFQNSRPRSIASLYELINAQVSIPGSTPQAQPTIYPSPLFDPGQLQQLLPVLLDECTTSNATEIPARINVNTAPPTVLMSLPNISPTDVQSILANRPSQASTDAPDAIYQTTAWLIIKANMSANTLRALERYITARTQVYRVQSVGFFDAGGPSARVESVIDTNLGYPRIIYYRDLTELGRGFSQSVLGESTPQP